MTFAWPHLLWLLALPLALLVAEIALSRRSAHNGGRDKILRGEAGPRSLALDASSNGHRRPLRRIWLALGLALCLVALARPQWGKVDEQVFDHSREILVALDLSRSMLSTDVKPTRLDRAKLLVQVLLDRLKGERVGLAVFSGTAFLQCPMSTDYEILRDFLPSLNPSTLPEGGTNYRALLQTALNSFGTDSSADRFLIILSDGEALDDDWQPLVPELQKRGIRVIGLGVGTKAGSFIPDGSGGFVKDENGAVVLSKLEPSTLQQLATATDGTYRDASDWVDLATVVKQTVEAGRKGSFVEKHEQRAIERYQWVLAPGVILLLISLGFEFPVQVRPRQVNLGKPATEPAKSVDAGRVALLLLAIGLLAGHRLGAQEPAAKGPSTPLGRDVARLSSKPALAAGDCADLARQTISWGQGLRSQGQPLPEGPLRDASDAIDLGERLGPKAADWNGLRSQLNALSEKPPEQKKEQPKQQNQKQQDQKKQDQQKQDSQDKSSSSQSKDQQKNDEQKQDQQKQSSSRQNQNQPSQQKQQPSGSANDSEAQHVPQPMGPQSGFGDMKKPAQAPQPTPPEAEPMQTVGGADRQAARAKEDPALLVPLEKLDQVKTSDSPGKLFEMIQAERHPQPAPANKKDW